nr:hypothetical protein [Tanacetum cinerariifolium]
WINDQDEGDDDDQDTDNDGVELVHPKLSIHEEEETKDEESFDPIVQTPKNSDDEANFSEFVQTNQFVRSVSSIPGIFQRYMDQRMNEAVKVKVQVSKILPKIEKTVNGQLEAEVLTRSSNSSKTSYAVAADLSEMELKKILIEKIESNKSIHRSDKQRNLYKALVEAYESDKIILDIYGDTVTVKKRRDDADKDEDPSAGSDRGSKRRREGKKPESTSDPKEKATKTTGKSTQGSKSYQKTASKSAPTEEPMQTTQDLEEPLHQEFETGVADDQPIVKTSQHPEWFQLQKKPPTPDRAWNKTMPTTQKSIQLWISDLAKQADSRSSFNELMDIPGSCKSLVELEFFLEEVYKATTYQLDWNNPERHQYPYNLLKPLPLIPNSRGRRVILFDHFINNDLEYLRGGASSRKYTTFVTKTKAVNYGNIKWIEDLFYRFVVSRESARDVYSKRRIIAVTKLQIVEWHNYKHLDWITVRRDDDKLYKFKEGYLKRLRIQDTKDMLLLLNKEKQNRLMRIDELHKFSDGTLNDVRTALDDHLKGIRMKYLPQAIWRKSDMERAASMIQASDKQLKTRRIMRSLGKFVGGRLCEGDFRMLQQTI